MQLSLDCGFYAFMTEISVNCNSKNIRTIQRYCHIIFNQLNMFWKKMYFYPGRNFLFFNKTRCLVISEVNLRRCWKNSRTLSQTMVSHWSQSFLKASQSIPYIAREFSPFCKSAQVRQSNEVLFPRNNFRLIFPSSRFIFVGQTRWNKSSIIVS